MEDNRNQQDGKHPRAEDLLRKIRKGIGDQPEAGKTPSGSAKPNKKAPTADPLIEKRKESDEKADEQEERPFSLEEFYGYSPMTREVAEREGKKPKKQREKLRRTSKTQEKSPRDYEYDLMSIFGMEERQGESAQEFDEEDEESEVPAEESFFARTRKNYTEYTDPSMKGEIFAGYRRRLLRILADLVICLLLGLFVFGIEYSEKLSFELPGFLRIDVYPAVGILLEIQVLVLATALKIRSFLRGGLNLILGHATPESVYFLTVISTVAVYFVQLADDVQRGMTYFGQLTLLSAILFSLYELVNLIYELRCFRIVSSNRVKKAIHRLSREEAKMEMSQMSSYLPYGNKFLSVRQTEQVGGFYKHLNTTGKAESRIRFLVFGALLLAVGFGLFTFFTGGSVATAIFTGYTTLMLALPMSVYFCCSYPMYMLALHAKNEDSAVIGGCALDSCLPPATITFSDTDVFPRKGVRLKGFKGYGSMPYHEVVCIAAAVLCPTGGSLGKVLEDSIDSDLITDDMEYLSVSDDGIEAAVDGRHVLLGNYHYIVRNRLTLPLDEEGEEQSDSGVQMFLVVDNEVVGRLTLLYSPGRNFKNSLKLLIESGMTIVVKTFDPNIDLSLLCDKLKIDERQPIKVIHTEDPLDLYEIRESVESPIVTLGGIRNMTEALRHAARVRNVIGICTALAAVSIALAGVIMAAVLRLYDPTQIPVYYLALYQLFWLVPGIVVSRLFS